MKNQALFTSKDKSKKLKCCLLQFLFGALKVNPFTPDTSVVLLYKQCRPSSDVALIRVYTFCLQKFL